MRTAAVVPVKALAAAHSRLGGSVSGRDRRRLAESLLLDLLAKLRRSRILDQAIVVTSDPAVARGARWLGHGVVDEGEQRGHSSAAALGARAAKERGFDRVAMLPTDCPLLDVEELDARLGRAPRSALIVPDRHGTGTNALVLSPPDAFAPAFGPDSCARHLSRARAAGVSFALERMASLALDLDTREDLVALRDALIVDPTPAARTARVLWEIGAEAEAAAV